MGDWNGREWNVGFDGRVRRFYRHWVGYYGLFQVLWLKNSDEDEDCTVLLEMGEKKRFLLETKVFSRVAHVILRRASLRFKLAMKLERVGIEELTAHSLRLYPAKWRQKRGATSKLASFSLPPCDRPPFSTKPWR